MKVLVAEDQADLSRLLKIAIEHEGFTVDIANNGQEAVDGPNCLWCDDPGHYDAR